MESTKPENNFSMDDFEKGLMLSGYIMPGSVQDIREREALEQYERAENEASRKLHFKRVVLAAEIAFKLWNEPSFGRVKFQKLVYLCEYAAEMELTHRYQKQVAGPFDNKFMHSIDIEFKNLNWFLADKITKDGYTRFKYSPLENANGYLKYYERYFKNENSKIQFIINLFRNKSTDETEIAATLHACIRDLATQNSKILTHELIKLFYAWSDKKKRFKEDEILKSLSWMEENHLIDFEIRFFK